VRDFVFGAQEGSAQLIERIKQHYADADKFWVEFGSAPDKARSSPGMKDRYRALAKEQNSFRDSMDTLTPAENRQYARELLMVAVAFPSDPKMMKLVFAYGDAAVEPLVGIAKNSKDIAMRGGASSLLGKVYPQVSEANKTIIMNALAELATNDPDASVRASSVVDYADVAGEKGLPALEKIAAGDPYCIRVRENDNYYMVREVAAGLIADIKSRMKPVKQ